MFCHVYLSTTILLIDLLCSTSNKSEMIEQIERNARNTQDDKLKAQQPHHAKARSSRQEPSQTKIESINCTKKTIPPGYVTMIVSVVVTIPENALSQQTMTASEVAIDTLVFDIETTSKVFKETTELYPTKNVRKAYYCKFCCLDLRQVNPHRNCGSHTLCIYDEVSEISSRFCLPPLRSMLQIGLPTNWMSHARV